jgi:integrase
MAIETRYLKKRDADGNTVRGPDGKPVDDRTKPRYLVRIASIDPATGKRRNTTIGTYRTKREAEHAERVALIKHETGTLVDPKKTTVAELLDTWLGGKAGAVSVNSLKDYEITIRRHVAPALGATKVQRLTPAQLQAQMTAWRDAGLQPRTIARCHSVLNQALAQAIEWGIVTRNICSVVKRPSIGKRPATVWSRDEWSAFLELAKADTLAPLWYFLAVEGMRRGEALGLRWSDVNWERGTVHIAQSVVPDRNDRGRAVIQSRAKTAAGSRSVRLTAETLAVLREHRDRQAFQRQGAEDRWQDYGLIVCTSTGTPINPNNVTRSYDRLVMLSGVPRIRVHDMRHTAATMLLRAGVPAKIVSERLGHATIAIILDTYSHVLPDMQDVAAEAMSTLLNAKDRTA